MDSEHRHHTERGFRNLHVENDSRLGDFLRWQWKRLGKKIPSASSCSFPLAQNDPSFLRENRSRPTVTWIGQATLLIQQSGLNILTDPHFSRRASPLSWLGPERAVPPGILLEELPPIDLVLISHNHYDHLDRKTIKALLRRPRGDSTLFIVPLGVGKWLRKRGAARVVELDWWEEHRLGEVGITALPVQHWSKRGVGDAFQTLWAGFALEGGGLRIVFLGDTGYSPHFREIRRRLGPVDLAAIPIGAYEPRWFMQRQHMNPGEAVQAHLDLQAELSIAIHWGTFVLTDEPLDEPPRILARELERRNVSPDDFRVLRHGQTFDLDRSGTLWNHSCPRPSRPKI